MNEKYARPVSREVLLFTVEMALREASKLRPKKRVPGDRDRLKLVAPAVGAHIELCGICYFGKSPVSGPMAASSGGAGRGG